MTKTEILLEQAVGLGEMGWRLWWAAKGATVAGERERRGEGPLPDPPLTAHAQATCLGTWSVALFL